MLKFIRSLFTPSTDRALKALTKTIAQLEAAAIHSDSALVSAASARTKLADAYLAEDANLAERISAAENEAARARKVISKLNTLIEA